MNFSIKSSDDHLLIQDKKVYRNALTAFFWSIFKNHGFGAEFHYGLGILKSRSHKSSRRLNRKNRVENPLKNEIKIESEIVSNPGLCLVQIYHSLIFLLLQALCSNFDSVGNQLQLAWLKNYFSISKLVFKRNFGGKWAILEWNWRWKSI